jgi:hypothetical protein
VAIFAFAKSFCERIWKKKRLYGKISIWHDQKNVRLGSFFLTESASTRVRGKEKVSGENALIMFAYNFKRVLNILGTAMFKKLLIAIKDGNIEQIVKDIQAYRRNIRVFIGYIFNNDFLCLYSTENRVYAKI